METQIVDLILKNGVAPVVMALIVMILVGIVKIFTKGVVNKKVVSERAQKWLPKLYLFLALILSGCIVLFYRAVILQADLIQWGTLKDIGLTWTLTQPLYQIYKQFGGRKVLVWFATFCLNLFKGKNKDLDETIDMIMKIIEDSAPLLTDSQKENIKNGLEGKVKLPTEAKTETEKAE